LRTRRETTRPIPIGLVGAGVHAYRNILPLLSLLPVELRAITDLDFDLAKRTAAESGARAYPTARDMYATADLTAVLICVSPQAHPVLAMQALRADVHVWMEKPAAATVADVDAVEGIRGDRVVMVGYKKAFMPAVTKTRTLIDAGEIGRVRTISGVYPLTIPLGARSYIDQRPDSLWLANGCHPLSVLVAIAGRVESVTVHRAAFGGGALILKHANGVLSNLHLADGAPSSQPFESYTVYGDDKTITIENSRRVTLQRGIGFGPTTVTYAPEGLDSGAVVWEAQDSLNTYERRSDFTQGLYFELSGFFDCIRTGGTPAFADLAFARHMAEIHEAAILSDHNEINLEEINAY
jgi:predicted dehydrogenase